MNVRVLDALALIVRISEKYPTEEIRVNILAGKITLGIPKSIAGDEFFAEWCAKAPAVEA